MTATTDMRDRFIQRVVSGHTFCDVGGLWGTVKEKVSVAAEAGATSTTMLDISSLDNPLWTRFSDRLTELSVEDAARISGNIDDPDLPNFAGPFDVVHCSGVVYHCPNPLYTIAQLARITTKYLIFTSIVIPERIETSAGVLETPPGHAVFLPFLEARQREILQHHFEELGIGNIIGIGNPFDEWSVGDYRPWWWLTPASTMRRQIESAGWRVIEDGPVWAGRSHGYLAQKR
jgi:hypothetical protein